MFFFLLSLKKSFLCDSDFNFRARQPKLNNSQQILSTRSWQISCELAALPVYLKALNYKIKESISKITFPTREDDTRGPFSLWLLSDKTKWLLLTSTHIFLWHQQWNNCIDRVWSSQSWTGKDPRRPDLSTTASKKSANIHTAHSQPDYQNQNDLTQSCVILISFTIFLFLFLWLPLTFFLTHSVSLYLSQSYLSIFLSLSNYISGQILPSLYIFLHLIQTSSLYFNLF